MKPDEIAVVIGGTSMPLWLPVVNQWVGLVVGLLSICYLIVKLWRIFK